MEPLRADEPVFWSAVTDIDPEPLPEVLSIWNQVSLAEAVQELLLLTVTTLDEASAAAKEMVDGVADNVVFTSGSSFSLPPQAATERASAAMAI